MTSFIEHPQFHLHLEQLRVARFDLVGLLFYVRGVLLHCAKILEGRAACPWLDLVVRRELTRQVNDVLLTSGRHEPTQEQARRSGIGRRLEHGIWVRAERSTLERVNNLDRGARLLAGKQ